MNIKEIVQLLNAKVACGEELVEREVRYAFGSDLMSDVLAFGRADSVLLTGLMNCQVIRTAEMLDLNVIVFVRGKIPTEEIKEMAADNKIAVLTTTHTLYTACGILYSNGLEGIEIKGE